MYFHQIEKGAEDKMRKISKKLSRLEIEDIIEDLRGGKSMKQIAKEHDISDTRVADIRDSVDDVAEMAHIHSKLTTEQKKKIKQMYSENVPQLEIARRLDIKDVFSVMEYCDSVANDKHRINNSYRDICLAYHQGWDKDDIAKMYNISPASASGICTQLRNRDILQDYKAGITADELIDMYDLDADELSKIICSQVRHELKGA